ncbi:MAG: YvrJ family protein [Deltaproteobacteria bacterium]|nr:YvrJ family protein [Deltaproteobacteria bacterium]
MDDLVKLISTIGFPAAVTIFVLVRLETRLRELTTAVQELRHALIGRKPFRSTDPPPESPA